MYLPIKVHIKCFEFNCTTQCLNKKYPFLAVKLIKKPHIYYKTSLIDCT